MREREKLNKRLYRFALSIVKIVREFPKETAGFEIGRQLVKSGTSIAANYEEAKAGFSKEDFIYKLSISFKESKETSLWLRLVKDSNLSSNEELDAILEESLEISNILAKSLKTARGNLKEQS